MPNENSRGNDAANLNRHAVEKERRQLKDELRAIWQADPTLTRWKSKVPAFFQYSHRPLEKRLFEITFRLEALEAKGARVGLATELRESRVGLSYRATRGEICTWVKEEVT